MDPMKKKYLVETNAKKYKSIEPKQKEALLKKNRESMKYKYQTMDPLKEAKFNPLLHDLDNYISRFHNKIKEGPYYVCSVCNRLLYRKSVMLLQKNKYINVNEILFTDIKSFDDKEYICKTCHSKFPARQYIITCMLTKYQLNLHL